eukprot:34244-Eustigmatos_ZCMA.PRE.1
MSRLKAYMPTGVADHKYAILMNTSKSTHRQVCPPRTRTPLPAAPGPPTSLLSWPSSTSWPAAGRTAGAAAWWMA